MSHVPSCDLALPPLAASQFDSSHTTTFKTPSSPLLLSSLQFSAFPEKSWQLPFLLLRAYNMLAHLSPSSSPYPIPLDPVESSGLRSHHHSFLRIYSWSIEKEDSVVDWRLPLSWGRETAQSEAGEPSPHSSQHPHLVELQSLCGWEWLKKCTSWSGGLRPSANEDEAELGSKRATEVFGWECLWTDRSLTVDSWRSRLI